MDKITCSLAAAQYKHWAEMAKDNNTVCARMSLCCVYVVGWRYLCLCSCICMCICFCIRCICVRFGICICICPCVCCLYVVLQMFLYMNLYMYTCNNFLCKMQMCSSLLCNVSTFVTCSFLACLTL